jgi:serine/threonine protein kinase
MNQSPKRKRTTKQKTALTPTRPHKNPQTKRKDDDDDFHLNTNTTSNFHSNLSAGIIKSPFLARVNNSGSTVHSGKTSNATDSLTNSFYSQDDPHIHSLAIKLHDTPYARTPEIHETTEVLLDQSFVSEISSPRSPLNFDYGEKISPVRPENEPFHIKYSSKKSRALPSQIDMNSCAISSPKLVPHRSLSPTLNILSEFEDPKNEKSYTKRIFDSYGAEYVQDEYYSSSCSSSGELNLSQNEYANFSKQSFMSSSHSLPSTSVLQNDSDDPEYDSLPNSNSTSRTLFREDSPCALPDESLISQSSHQHSTQATPDRLLANQHQHRLEDAAPPFTPAAKQRNLSLPPSSSLSKAHELENDSSSLFRSRSHNRVLTTSTPVRPNKRMETPIRRHSRPQLSSTSTPDRLTSQTSTPPRHDHLQLPYQLLHSPPPASTEFSPSDVLRGVGFTSPSFRERSTIEESWTGCKSLFPYDDHDNQSSLHPPQRGTTPIRLKQNGSPEKRIRRSSSKEKLLHSSESNMGKRSRSPFSSLPSPTEMRVSQHQKIDTPENSPCPTPRRQATISRPLPDQSVFESSQHAMTHQGSPVCPPTPERVSHRHAECNPCDENIFFLRTNEDEDLFHSPRLYRQNSLEENKILMSSQPIPHSHENIPDDNLDSHLSELHEPHGSLMSTSTSLNTSTTSSADLHFHPQDHNHPHPHSNPNNNILFYRDFMNEGLMGSGTFAEVYRVCLKSDPTQKFAVKKCRKKFKNKSERETLLNEVRIMQAIAEGGGGEGNTSPYVLHFYNAWQEDSYFYVQLELAERGTLRDLMNIYAERRQFIPTRDLLQIFYQITSGLQHIHHLHIVHLDIKPQNILITTDGILKIGDFGIAVYEGANVADERHEGDTKYLPEELLNSSDRYSSADIFSLGLSIYELCLVPQLDTFPYSGQGWHDIRQGIIEDLTQIKYGSRCQELVNLLLKCISSNPNKRPTATEILSNSLFHSNMMNQSTSILKESPIRAPSPIYNPQFNFATSTNTSTNEQISSPVVATPTSHHSGHHLNWQQRMQSPSSPYLATTPGYPPIATPFHDQVAPFSLRNYHSNQFLNELALSEEPNTPTTFSLSQLYRSTPRHLTPSRDSTQTSNDSQEMSSSQPSTPQSSLSQRIPPLSGIRLSIPIGPPTPSQESLTTPTSRLSRPQFPFPPTPIPPATVLKASRKGGGSKLPKKK